MRKIFILLFCIIIVQYAAAYPTTGCVGGVYNLGHVSMMYGSPSTTWQSSDTTIATIDSFTGVIHAVAPGHVSFTQSFAATYLTLDFTVYPSLSPVSGADTLCVGGITSLSDAVAGGIWTTNDSFVVSLAPTTGVTTALHGGNAEIIYMASGHCASHSIFVAGTVVDSFLSGNDIICAVHASLLSTLHTVDSSGIWTSSNPSIATVTSAAGSLYPAASVLGFAAGTATISYSYTSTASSGGCAYSYLGYQHITVLAAPIPSAIFSSSSVLCLGSSVTLTDTLGGGLWFTSNPLVATISSTTFHSCFVLLNALGTAVVTYRYTGYCGSTYINDSANYFVNVLDIDTTAVISGLSSVCSGSTITLTCAPTGGIWSSSSAAATVDTAGHVSGVSAGTVVISYMVSGSCAMQVGADTLVVFPAPAVPIISGPSVVCSGMPVSLSVVPSGGIFASLSPSVATITAGGLLTGLATGPDTITYSVSTVCGSSSATFPVAILGATHMPSAITGLLTAFAGSTVSFSDSVAGGTWSASPSSVGVIDTATGLFTAISSGTATVTYTTTGCSGSLSVTSNLTIVPLNVISGNIDYAGGPGGYVGDIKVWLITYASPILTAVDSMTIYSPGSGAAYQFTGVPVGTYRVKAASLAAPSGTTGYIPTYYSTNYYWNAADTIAHLSTMSDTGKDIHMAYGTATTGPGFIGGDVTTGANKGTSASVPVEGLMTYIFNSSTMQLMQAVRTDATGHYSFSNLPVGQTYQIFPDSLNYLTTPYIGIQLTTGVPSMNSANFTQHTLSHTITPDSTLYIANAGVAHSNVSVLPNPTTGTVNIVWQLSAMQQAKIMLFDMLGRAVYNSSITMVQGNGSTLADFSSLDCGIYYLTIKAETINYGYKLKIEH